jgi:hypothetical protein
VSGLPPVRKSLIVPLERGAAFELFFLRLPEWWPLQHRSATDGAVSCHVEPRPGGRLYERTRDGGEADWGTFRVWDEPSRAVFTWHPGLPPGAATEVEVAFTAVAEGTRVDLVHRDWERLGARGSFVRDLFDNGWPGILARFAAHARGAPPPPWIDVAGCRTAL